MADDLDTYANLLTNYTQAVQSYFSVIKRAQFAMSDLSMDWVLTPIPDSTVKRPKPFSEAKGEVNLLTWPTADEIVGAIKQAEEAWDEFSKFYGKLAPHKRKLLKSPELVHEEAVRHSK